MFDLQDKQEQESVEEGVAGLNKLRGILVSSAKETAFRKVVQATMVRDKQHGPVVELNRIQVHVFIDTEGHFISFDKFRWFIFDVLSACISVDHNTF